MNANQLINMIVRMGMRMVMRKAMTGGMSALSRGQRGRQGDARDETHGNARDNERGQEPSVGGPDSARRLKKTARMVRRTTRF